MRAICLTKYGSIENFASVDLPTREPKRGQIRVRVHASAVGPADFKVTTGQFNFLHGRKFPMILGYDFSGVVDAVGYGQTRWKIGDPVFGFLPYGPGNNQGAFAEFLVTPDNQVARKPASVSHDAGAFLMMDMVFPPLRFNFRNFSCPAEKIGGTGHGA